METKRSSRSGPTSESSMVKRPMGGLVTMPIKTIRGVFDSMIYIHNLACSISESLQRITSRKNIVDTDDSPEEKSSCCSPPALCHGKLFTSLSLSHARVKLFCVYSCDNDAAIPNFSRYVVVLTPLTVSVHIALTRLVRTPITLFRAIMLKSDDIDGAISVSSTSSSDSITFSFSGADGNGTSFIVKAPRIQRKCNRHKDSDEGDEGNTGVGNFVIVLFEDILINKNPVLRMLPNALSSRLVSLFEIARSGQLMKPQAVDLKANIVEYLESAKREIWRRGFYGWYGVESIPRMPNTVGLTGVVLKYDVVDSETSNRLTRYMHYDIDRRPFLAKVSLPASRAESRLVERDARKSTEDDESVYDVCTPQSFPPSPYAREALLNDFETFTSGILHAARDRLELESSATAGSGDEELLSDTSPSSYQSVSE